MLCWLLRLDWLLGLDWFGALVFFVGWNDGCRRNVEAGNVEFVDDWKESGDFVVEDVLSLTGVSVGHPNGRTAAKSALRWAVTYDLMFS